jgi:hypothetical protein
VSISQVLDESQVRGLLAGQVALADLLSPAQVSYMREVVAVWPIPSGLKNLGPAQIETYHRKGKPFVVELWQFPSGRSDLKISQKSRLEDARHIQSKLEEMLERKKVKLCPDQGALAAGRLKDLLGQI